MAKMKNRYLPERRGEKGLLFQCRCVSNIIEHMNRWLQMHQRQIWHITHDDYVSIHGVFSQ